MKTKLIIWGTGLVGSNAIAGLARHPNFEIVGAIVNSESKHGRDIGELAGTAKLGVLASTDADSVLAMEADAVAYFGPSALYADINMDNLEKALRAGKNVVDTSMGAFENPRHADPALVARIEQACAAGNSTFFSSGIDPGFANDLFPITLSGISAQIDSIRTIEFIDASSYPDQEALINLGLGSDPAEPGLLDMEGMITAVWGGPLYMIAEALGVEIESTREVFRRWATPEAFDYPLGRIEAGRTAAYNIELQGIVDGEPRIFVDHYHRLFADAAPDWPRPTMNKMHANRIEIFGKPNIVQETIISDPVSGDGNAGGCLSTGMRMINAIPAVCQAAPGVLSTLDLPLIAGRGALH